MALKTIKTSSSRSMQSQCLTVVQDQAGVCNQLDLATCEDDFEDTVAQEVADDELSSSDVLGRIEAWVAEYIANLATGSLPTLDIVSRRKANQFYAQHDQGGVAVAVGGGLQRRCMLANQGAQANAYTRVFVVLHEVHSLLRQGCTVTQRDLYYKLKGSALFNSPKDVNTAIQDVVALLRVPRAALGVKCASRGAVAGHLRVKDHPTAAWQDCLTIGTDGKAIPGDLGSIDAMSFQCTASYLLVVEKDAVFHRLVEDGLFTHLSCVLVTAKGFPDLATRAFCAQLMNQFPSLIPLALVDYNPHGVTILRTYKFGSAQMGLESHRHAIPGLSWLGLRSNWLVDVDASALALLEQRDLNMLPGLRSSFRAAASQEQSKGGTSQREAPSMVASQQANGNAGFTGVTASQLAWGDDDTDKLLPCAQMQASSAAYMHPGSVHTQQSDSRCDTDSDEMADEEDPDTDDAVPAQMQRWLSELDIMEASGYKADIESLYSLYGYAGLKDMLVRAVLRKEYI